MLKNRLFKRYGTKKFQDAGTVTKPEETGLSIPTIEDIKKNFAINNPFVLDSYTTEEQPKGTVSTGTNSFAPGTFSDLVKSPLFTTGFSPLNPYDVNPKTPEAEQGPMTKEQSDYFVLDQTTPQTTTPKENNTPAMVSLGLLGFDALLGKSEDLKNQQKLNESIQQRKSKPEYSYNFMYGPTTSGGTEFQPTIKAEMGAKINKRYASEGINDVEIEGGEFIQLPNLDTEMAEGPSHSNGGIPTNLPNQTRVYSNNLKPEGSKKTFAQIAKNYDTTSYKKTLDNTFAKQVDKDTAQIMMQRNQKILDQLFSDQQAMNGNSNGELEAKNGAGINNSGFKSLPGYVQAKIMSNMADGGVDDPLDELPRVKAIDPLNLAAMSNINAIDPIQESFRPLAMPGGQVPPATKMEYFQRAYSDILSQKLKPRATMDDPTGDLPSVKAIDPLNLAAMTTLNQLESQSNIGTSGNPTTSNTTPNASPAMTAAAKTSNIAARSKNALFDPTKPGMPAHTNPESQFLTSIDPSLNPSLETVPGVQTSLGTGVYGEPSNIDIFNKNYSWYLDDLKASGETFDPSKEGDVRRAQVAYTEEAYNRFKKQGIGEEEARKKADEIGFVATKSLQNSVDDMLGRYTATRILPENTPPTPVTPGEKPAMDLIDGQTPQPEKAKSTTTQTTTGRTFTGPGAPAKGKYIPGQFPLYQAIPEAMGLAQSQQIYPYAIPEIDAPYVRPQTLNIQSQLQDIDSMATAAQRAGGDPLTTYIAGLDAKQKAFQAKQNYDAEGRSRADMANAQMSMSADQINAQYFDRVYNNLVGQARDAQSAEKQAAVASLTNKKAKFTQDETKKSAYINALMENYDVDSKGNFTLKPGKNPVINSNPAKTAKKGMYKK
jgi:hypothetical protein